MPRTPDIQLADGLTIGTYDIARAITAEQLAEVIVEYLNGAVSIDRRANEMALYLTGTHRSLQEDTIAFMLSTIIQYGEQYDRQWNGFTDLRNQHAYSVAKTLAEMSRAGKL